MKDSSESPAEQQPPKCWRDELLAPVTPTSKPCRGAEEPPRRALLHTGLQNPRDGLGRVGRRSHNLLSHSNAHAHSSAPSLPAPQLPRKSGTGARESGLELPPPPLGPAGWVEGAERRTRTPGPTPPCGARRQARARSTGNEVFFFFFFFLKFQRVPSPGKPP